MIEVGFDAWAHVRELSVRGYVEVLRHLPRLLKLRRDLAERLSAAPAAFVGVDAPDFNLGLEEKLRARGIRVVHFISPSIWAWRAERIDQIRRAVDRMLLVFPFEQAIYDACRDPGTYVGHPLAEHDPDESRRSARASASWPRERRSGGRRAAGHHVPTRSATSGRRFWQRSNTLRQREPDPFRAAGGRFAR